MRELKQQEQQAWWPVEIEGLDDFDMSMKRIYAWFDNEIIDLTSRYNDSVEKKKQLQAELDKALKEIDSMSSSQPQEKGLPE